MCVNINVNSLGDLSTCKLKRRKNKNNRGKEKLKEGVEVGQKKRLGGCRKEEDKCFLCLWLGGEPCYCKVY
jgi:hypothetical protein